MKKGIFILFIFVILGRWASMAQPSNSTWLTTTAGLNSTWILNQNTFDNPDMDYGTKFGILGMIGLNHYINNKYGVCTGVGFENMGQTYMGDLRGAKADRKINLNYIAIPVFAMRQLCDPQHPCWLTFGPQFMILTSAKQKFTREEEGNELNHEAFFKMKDAQKMFKPLDVMLNLGFNNIYYMRTNDDMRLIISVNVAYGLLDINQKDYQIPKTGESYRGSHNFYVGAQAGFMFNP